MSSSSSNAAARRAVCHSCGRPLNVCLCAALPNPPVLLHGLVVILQHPHETKRRLATVPLLTRCLQPSSLLLLVGRKLQPGLFPQFDVVVTACQQQEIPLLVLWPGPGAQSISDVCFAANKQHQVQPGSVGPGQQGQQPAAEALAMQGVRRQQQHPQQPGVPQADLQQLDQHERLLCCLQRLQHCSHTLWQTSCSASRQCATRSAGHCYQAGPPLAAPESAHDSIAGTTRKWPSSTTAPAPAYVVLVVDGTWRHAKEMFDTLRSWLLAPVGPGMQVQLPLGRQQRQQQRQQQQTTQQQHTLQPVRQQHTPLPAAGVNGRGCGRVPDAVLQAAEQQLATLQLGQLQTLSVGPKAAAATDVSSCCSCGMASANCGSLYGGDASSRQEAPPADGTSVRNGAAAAALSATAAAERDGSGSHLAMISGCTVTGSHVDMQQLTFANPDIGSCRLRVEPREDCCTTYEAIAWAVSCLEAHMHPGLLPILMWPLQLMTQLQAKFDPAVQARIQPGSSGVVDTKSRLGLRNRLKQSHGHTTSNGMDGAATEEL